MEYTVIGDTVNTCSRLEQLTKDHGRRTLPSSSSADLVAARFPVVTMGVVPIRGRKDALAIYGLAAEDSPASATPASPAA